MPDSDDTRPFGGELRTSKVVVELELVHPGDPEVFIRHMLIELEVVVRRWGASLESSFVSSVRPVTGEDTP